MQLTKKGILVMTQPRRSHDCKLRLILRGKITNILGFLSTVQTVHHVKTDNLSWVLPRRSPSFATSQPSYHPQIRHHHYGIIHGLIIEAGIMQRYNYGITVTDSSWRHRHVFTTTINYSTAMTVTNSWIIVIFTTFHGTPCTYYHLSYTLLLDYYPNHHHHLLHAS